MLFPILAAVVLTIAIALFIKRYRKHLRKQKLRRSRETWAIGIYEGPSPIDLRPAAGVVNPVLTAVDVTDVPARFVADPFMVRGENGDWHLFFEVLNERRNKGEIGYATSRDGHQWRYGSIVLRDRHHLSYPYMFSWECDFYMIPECGDSGCIRIFRATAFPKRWEVVSTIAKGDKRAPVVDPSVFRHGGLWYLFSYGKNRSLHLFWSEELPGIWHEHPMSPVVTGSPQFARPGGRVIADGGSIYRYAQDETPHYGSKVWAFRITELTPTTYREEPVSAEPVLQAGRDSWNRDGMHTIDPHQIAPGAWLAAVDGFTIKSEKE
jgi:hypothetical protein